MRKTIIIICWAICAISAASALVALEDAIYAKNYYLSIYPSYPPVVGEKITLRLRSFKAAQKVTLYSDRFREIPMSYRDGYWWGKFQIPDDYQVGWHFFFVWIKQVGNKPNLYYWENSKVWYRLNEPPARLLLKKENSLVAEEGEPFVVLPVMNQESSHGLARGDMLPLVIKGTKSLSFTSRSLEGSREGYAPGLSREESLRLSIACQAGETQIDANLISTSIAGTAQNSQRDDRVSVLIKRASTEAYFGDFTADLNETEFARLNKVLSGVQLKGEYGRLGLTALYSSPKGVARASRFYGDGTQGPYRLGATQKVVINSERVYLNGERQRRGDDYSIDYDAGVITFKRRTILTTSVVEVDFDDSEAQYQHVTYAVRPTVKFGENAKLGGTYINDSDASSGISSLATAESLPRSHSVFGLDGSLLTDSGAFSGELAYSDQNPDLFSNSLPRLGGGAYKFNLSQQLGTIGLTGAVKRIDPDFSAIADPAPQQDLLQYGGGISYRPNSLFTARTKVDFNRYDKEGIVYKTELQSAAAGLTPENLPSLEYEYSQTKDSNDPVSGAALERVITRKAGESNARFGFLSASLKAAREEWVDHAPSMETTNYNRANFGLASQGNDLFSIASNFELEDREEPDGSRPDKKHYNVNLAATPGKGFFSSVAFDHIDDSALGVTDVADLAYRAAPADAVRTEGKYSISSLTEDYTSTEAVSKQTGSFSLDLRPSRLIRLKYLFKPNFTKLSRLDRITYFNEQSQAEVNLIPNDLALISCLQKYRHAYSIAKQDAPNYLVKDNSSDTVSTLYSLKLAPLPFVSTEFNCQIENGVSATLTSLEARVYQPGESFSRQIELLVRTSVSERLSFDSRLAYQRLTQGEGGKSDNVVDGVSHSVFLKGLYSATQAWSFSLAAAYSKNTNNLSPTPVSYTFAPGFGAIYRWSDRLRLDFDYLHSRSSQGVETEKNTYSFKGRYSISDYVNATIRWEREISLNPDYKTTDISGNVEIIL
ncbi:MAG: hypothetical protein ABIH56_02055 [Candidatus Margulisiibacteriota bacterium]